MRIFEDFFQSIKRRKIPFKEKYNFVVYGISETFFENSNRKVLNKIL